MFAALTGSLSYFSIADFSMTNAVFFRHQVQNKAVILSVFFFPPFFESWSCLASHFQQSCSTLLWGLKLEIHCSVLATTRLLDLRDLHRLGLILHHVAQLTSVRGISSSFFPLHLVHDVDLRYRVSQEKPQPASRCSRMCGRDGARVSSTWFFLF